jgi:hypothetical protein
MSDPKHAAPSLPDVVDEAADTPAWVPALGLGLAALISLVFAVQLAFKVAAPEKPAGEGNPAAQVAADGE